MYYDIYKSKFGQLILIGDDNGLSRLFLGSTADIKKLYPKEKVTLDHTFFKNTKKELDQYFAGQRKTFTTQLHPIGTDFQQKVWQEVSRIPYGTVCTYRDIAERVGSPRAFRAVGTALNQNRVLVIIPCHRVIRQSGHLTGYAHGLEMKQELLDLEKNNL